MDIYNNYSPVPKDVNIDRYYESTILPLLQPGKEGDLCNWLKSIGLLATEVKCPNPDCNNVNLTWCKARVVDKYNWSCPVCKKKLPIRYKSFLADFKCDLPSVIKGIYSWCKNVCVDDICDNNKLKLNVGKRIYGQCATVAEWYMQNHPEQSHLGGPDSVVLVDIFPDGNMTLVPHNNNYSKRILCIADTTFIPARVWAKILDSTHHNKENNNPVIEAVFAHVLPGSTLVTSQQLYNDLCMIKGMSDVVSVEALMKLDPPENQQSLVNLETIWSATVSVCTQVQEMTTTQGQQLLRELQWRQIYGSDALFNVLAHIVDYFNNQTVA
uniref:Uncharacterized protein n=1 Tax=Cacopsylla melanoneura TaxID=428564 RepID=A0A8D8PU84_9HEMI